ncbi:UDP-3-O-(3-hydroxymyristoyl)glucosamine N-acyltransferase [Alphaproteobacteria bacterium]|nr:UDP-3-O-(3-hydroxymyristoyl)glucosamine N-acyltransferase [Alphaproteobacteria bacterium]
MPDIRFYKQPEKISLKEIASHIGISCPEDFQVSGVSALEEAGKEDLAACFDKKMLPSLEKTKAGACIVSKDLLSYVPIHVIALCVKNPRLSFAKAALLLYPHHGLETGDKEGERSFPSTSSIASSAFIGKGVEIGEGTVIGPGSYIGAGVKIGKHCKIYDNVTLLKSIIGDSVSIHSGARVGSEGFGFVNEGPHIIDIPHLGRVLIKNNVRIGANTTIDRGVLGDTLIEEGCRIDNLVQIAHNVHLGKFCVVVSQVGISGSTVVGDFSVLAGQAGIAGHLKIGTGVTVAAKSGVMRDIKDGSTVSGMPAMPIREWYRQVIHLSKVIKK